MGKQKKLREAVAKSATPKQVTPLKVGKHTFPVFNGASAAFGARLQDYPPMSAVPEVLDEFLRPEARTQGGRRRLVPVRMVPLHPSHPNGRVR